MKYTKIPQDFFLAMSDKELILFRYILRNVDSDGVLKRPAKTICKDVGIGSWFLYNFTKKCEYIKQKNGNRTKTKRAYTIKLIDIKQFTNVSNIKQNVNRTETERKTAEKESTISEDDIKFSEGMKIHYPRCMSMPKPLTREEYSKLRLQYSPSEIKEVLVNMENYKELEKKYVSTYQTLIKWMKRNYE